MNETDETFSLDGIAKQGGDKISIRVLSKTEDKGGARVVLKTYQGVLNYDKPIIIQKDKELPDDIQISFSYKNDVAEAVITKL